VRKIIGYHYTNKELLNFFGIGEDYVIRSVLVIEADDDESASYWSIEATIEEVPKRRGKSKERVCSGQ